MEKNEDWTPTWFYFVLWLSILIAPIQLIKFIIAATSMGIFGAFDIVYTIITSIIHIAGCVLILRKSKYGFIIFVPIILNLVLSIFLWQDSIMMYLFTLIFWIVVMLIRKNGKPMYMYILEGK